MSTVQSYEMFLSRLSGEAQTAVNNIRRFCLSLDGSIVEDVRAHRIVYGKGMIFRWFADIEPREGGLVVKTQRGRRQEPLATAIPYGGDTGGVCEIIRAAYQAVR